MVSRRRTVWRRPVSRTAFISAGIGWSRSPHFQNWLKLDMSKLEAEVIAMPTRDDVTIPVEEQLIVELCSQ